MCSSDKFLELEVPPDCGNGLDNAGVPLAKLLFFLREQPLMTLIEARPGKPTCMMLAACMLRLQPPSAASMWAGVRCGPTTTNTHSPGSCLPNAECGCHQALLLERRILMVAADSDRVSAAVHAAAALIFPFRWQHIYLPLLPHALQVRCCQAPFLTESVSQGARQCKPPVDQVLRLMLVCRQTMIALPAFSQSLDRPLCIWYVSGLHTCDACGGAGLPAGAHALPCGPAGSKLLPWAEVHAPG